jgi:hypothetical protein
LKAIQTLKQLSPAARKALAGALCGLLLVLIYPFQTTVVPIWNLRVVDDAGAPVVGINVTQHWQHNLLESIGHEELQRTDEDGQVVFPARTIRASLVSRIRLRAMKLWREGSAAKFNRYASVVVWGSKGNETNVAVYDGDGTPPPQVIAKTIRSIN